MHGIHPERYLQLFAAAGQLQILFCLFALALQRADALGELAQNIAQTHQVFFGGVEAPFGLVFAVTVFCNAGRLFKNLAPLGRFRAHDLGDPALPDDGISVPAKARIQKQLVNIAQAHILPVDGIFAFTRTVVFAPDRHLVAVHVDAAVGVVHHQIDDCVSHCAALLRAAENHVLHFSAAAQLLGARLSQHPADCVGDIAFSAAVRSHHSGDPPLDGDADAVRKRFKALYFQRL